MKKLFSILILIFAFVISNAQTQPIVCCPKFELVTTQIQPCDDLACKLGQSDVNGGSPAGGAGRTLIACKNQQQKYLIVPNLPGFSYSWTVIGGTPDTLTNNPKTINWGSTSQGFMQVVISNADGSCKDTIKRTVCLIDGPTAAITFNPNPVCANSPVNFSGVTSLGATSYYWDFGDGSSSGLQIPPPHIFASPGLHTIILTVSSVVTDSKGNTKDCGCKDTAMVTVNVSRKPGIEVHTDDCRKMLCAGDTIKYCTSTTGCSSLNWVVSGGTIISGQGTTCATVVWNQPSTYPTSVTLNANCPNTCGNSTTLNVPVLYPNLPIKGPVIVCPGSNTFYSLPALPGTFYHWTLSGGGAIVGNDSNHNVINVSWNYPLGGPYFLICNYTNPYSGCSGSDTISINIKPKFTLNGLSPVCVGGTSTICANGNVQTWTFSPNTGFTNSALGLNCKQITWNNIGNYLVTATPQIATNFCSSPALLNLIVLDTPKLNSIVGPVIVCANQTVGYSISSNMNGGIFNWSITNGTITQYMGANKDSVLVNFTANGTISVSQTVAGCTSRPKIMNVSVVGAPPAPTGNTTVCIDATETYTVPGPVPPGGYTWTLSNALGTIIPLSANSINVQWNGGAASATCVISVAACGQTSSLTVTINNPPNGVLSATGNICTPGITLTTTPTTAPYSWYLNGVFLTTTPTPSYLATTPGFYKVKGTGCTGSASLFVPNTFISTVNITADNFLSYCTGDVINVNLTATVQSNNTCTYGYQWFNGASPVGTNNPALNVTGPGSYYVIISCGNCKDTSNIINISVGPCDHCSNFTQVFTSDLAGPSLNVTNDYEAPFSYSINIGAPSNLCNNVSFNATYNFTAPNSPNAGVNWDYGDGNYATTPFGGMSGTVFTPNHTYLLPGTYVVTAWMLSNCPPPPTPHICLLRDTIHYIVPVAANFGYSVHCNQVTLSDLSSTLPSLGCNILSYTWSVTGGATFNNNTIANPVLTATVSGTYNITLTVASSCNGCSATVTYPVIINVPTANITLPTPVCAGTAAPFSTSGAATNTYHWNFGDSYMSNLQSTTHTFAAPPPNSRLVTLTVTNPLGCVATDTQTVAILRPLSVSIPTDKYICSGSSFTLTTTPAVFGSYQWYLNGNAISGATNPTYNASLVGEYYVTVSNGTGCSAKSNKMKLWHHPLPIANIKGQTIQCITGTGYINVYNSVMDPNYTYSWTVNPASTFSPNNTQYYAGITVTTPGTYQFILTVTDTSTGCIAKDTFCVYVYSSPAVSIGPTGYLCEGINHTYTATATPANPNYIYQWNNGATGQTMTTGQAGYYYVTVVNPESGCFGQSNVVIIKSRPYVALFPIGCDTLCDTTKLIPPLPLGPGQNYGGVYNIQWYVDGVYNSNLPVLNLSTLSLGQHQIYMVVNFIGDSCASKSGMYDLFIKHCGDCGCDGSHWGEMNLIKGEKAPATKFNANVPQDNWIKLECKNSYTLMCNQAYSINANYICKDTACPPKVTYSLLLPNNTTQTGNGPFTFTPSLSGSYVLTMYGWCGGKICDSCVVKFVVNCKSCDCKGSKWGEKFYSIDNVKKQIVCDKNKVIEIKCKVPISLNANYNCADASCNGTVTYSMQSPSGATATGNMPFSFTPNQTGMYTVTMYGWCGDKICDSCVVKFKTTCDEISCCPYEIKADAGTVSYNYTQVPNATLLTENFNISGLASANITEVRANVVSYTITDNFGKECMKCVNLPFTWASISSATNIGTIAPKITMFGNTTVSTFSGSGTGSYQNPREIIWNNSTGIAIPNNTNIGLNVIVPPVPAIDCCELKGNICIKFTFRDNDCKECEVIKCFDFVIKKK